MDNAGFTEKSPNFSTAGMDDIPEALREISVAEPPRRLRLKPLLLGLLGFAIALLLAAVMSFASPNTTEPVSVAVAQTGWQTALIRERVQTSGLLLGHLPYDEAPADTLQAITADGSIKLRRAAAQKFIEMVAAANADGVILVAISGFRSLTDQNVLFFEVKAQQGENPRERAEVSAPPGYSEHHTGYAIDLGDGSKPDTHLLTSFDTTPAFQWLQRHAAFYNFELSFPQDNAQGVSYEPWHWRFVGDRTSLETFYKARE